MSVTPRRLLGLGDGIKRGEVIDATLVDFGSEFTVDPADFLSKGKSTPLEGMRLRGEVLLTIAKGKIAYEK
jgi:dihydroorotase